MRSIILSTAARYLLPLMVLFSIFVLLRGHNEPGGGFIGGLIVAAAYTLHGVAFGIRSAQNVLRAPPRLLVGFGLLAALTSGLIAPLFTNEVFMKGLWGTREFPLLHKLGTPLLFDIGVYLTVIGVTLWIIFSLAESYLQDPVEPPEG